MTTNTKHLALLLLLAGMLYQACTPKTAKPISDVAPPAETAPAPPPANTAVQPASPSGLDLSADIPVDKDVRMGQLDNGLKYFIRKNTQPENRAELRLALAAGAMQEDEDQQGLAHFVEHMAFNGTRNFAKSELVDYLESIGTRFGPDLNAYTSFDETVYMLQARTDDKELLQKALLILEDWAGGVTFDNEEIDKERGVVESEWRSRLSPQQRMTNEFYPVMYYGSRYAKRLPIGKPEIIRGASYETVKRFYRDWYRPNLMAVVVVGDFDVDAMEKEIKERFSKLKNPATLRSKESYPVPDHKETLVSIASDKEAPFTNIRLMYKHDYDKMSDMKDYRTRLVHRLYNSMLDARLEEITQSPNPPFTFAYTGYGRDVGDLATYESFAMVPEGGAQKGLEAILMENERVLRHGFTTGEFSRAKLRLLTRMEKSFKEKDKTDSRRFAMRYVYHYLDGNPIPSLGSELEFYQKMLPDIQLNEVNQLAKQWITDENRVVVVTGPKKEGSPLPAEAAIRQVLSSMDGKDIPPYVDQVSDEPLMASIPESTNISEEKQLESINATELKLANGIRVILKPTDFKNDEVLMRAFSPGGSSQISDEDFPKVRFATRIISESGLGSFDYNQLQKKLTGKLVRVSPYISELYEGFRGSSSPKDIETMLQMVHMYFTMTRKDEKVLQSLITKQEAVYKNLMSQPRYYFSDQVQRIQFDGHPRRGFPQVDEMEKISLDKVYDFYQDRFQNAGDFTFLFVGNFEVEKIKPMLATYLGSLPTTERQEKGKDVGANYVKGTVKKQLVKGEAPKSQVNLTWHGDFEYNSQNAYDFNTMIQVLRIKMRESMREDKGGVYGVGVRGRITREPQPKYSITVSFNADPPRMQELIETALSDIAKTKEQGVEEKDLTKVSETQRQGRIKDMKENSWWVRSLERSYQEGSDVEKLKMEVLESYIEKLDSDAIKNAANQYFDMTNFIQITMVPQSPENQ
ncbi:MAG: insulinase family protein [Bacteroidota bacterium]